MTKPLTPEDCDLRDFPFLQLDVVRLRDSDLAAMCSPEECWAAVLLWCASWHQVPAASLPDNDMVLSNLAGYGRVVKEWQRVKEGAMHGWVLCSDGRWYHPVIAEKANNALTEKRLHHYGKFRDRARKAHGKNPEPLVIPDFDEWISAGMPTELSAYSKPLPLEGLHVSAGKGELSAGIPLETQTLSAGKGELSAGIPLENALKGEGEGELKPIQSSNEDLSVSPKKPPPCPHSAIIAMYHKWLPGLKRVAESRWQGSSRATNLARRWSEDPRHREIDFWDWFFSVVAADDFYSGRSGKWSGCDLGWLLERKNFDKIIDLGVSSQQSRAA